MTKMPSEAASKAELRYSSIQETRDDIRFKALVREVGEGVQRGLEAIDGHPWYSSIATAHNDTRRT